MTATSPIHEKTAGSSDESSELVKSFEKRRTPAMLKAPASQKPRVIREFDSRGIAALSLSGDARMRHPRRVRRWELRGERTAEDRFTHGHLPQVGAGLQVDGVQGGRVLHELAVLAQGVGRVHPVHGRAHD